MSATTTISDRDVKLWGRAAATLDRMATFPWPAASVVAAAREHLEALVAAGVPAPLDIFGDTRGCVQMVWRGRRGDPAFHAHLEVGRHAARLVPGADRKLCAAILRALHEAGCALSLLVNPPSGQSADLAG